MANTDNPKGLAPIASPHCGIKRTEYDVYPSVATAIYLNDPAVLLADGTVTIATAGAGNALRGSFMSFTDSTGGVVGYVPATPGSGYKCTIADDPHQEFLMQEDSDGGALAATDRGTNVDMIAGTGSTTTNLSGWEIDSSTAGTSASKQLRLVRPHAHPANSIGSQCDWIVTINNHQAAPGIVGGGI